MAKKDRLTAEVFFATRGALLVYSSSQFRIDHAHYLGLLLLFYWHQLSIQT